MTSNAPLWLLVAAIIAALFGIGFEITDVKRRIQKLENDLHVFKRGW